VTATIPRLAAPLRRPAGYAPGGDDARISHMRPGAPASP